MGGCRWRTRDVWWRLALLLLLVVASPSNGIAQTAFDPRLIEFQSPDHLTTDANNVPLIDRYELNLFELGSITPVATVNLGKPPLASDGYIHLDLLSVLPSWPLPPGATYEARITALGPTGAAASGYSNPFTFTGPCSISATPATATVAAAGGSGSVSVSAGSSCQWTATSAAPWITLASASGTGARALGYTVAVNTASSPRTGSFTVGSTVVTITQAASGCGFSVSSNAISVAAAGVLGTLNVLSPNGCNWTLSSQSSWISLLSTGGTTSKTIAYNVPANTAAASRTGTFTAAGLTVTVTQAGTQSQSSSSTTTTNTSTPSTSSTPAPLANVVDPKVLEFSASPDHFTLGPDGQPVVRGYELVIVQVPQNTTILVAALGKPAPDASGLIRVDLTKYLIPTPPAGVTYEARVNALGATGSASSDLSNPFVFSVCTPVVTPGTTSFAAFPGLSSATVAAPAACGWATSSASAWITVGAGGSGNQTVSYSIAPNTATSSRTGSITIAGRVISITQDGAAPSTPSTPPPAAPGTAQFVRTDTTSRGTWRGAYGTDGYLLMQDATALPAYAQVSASGTGNWVWASNTTDVRGLQRVNGTSRLGAQWYSTGATMTVDVTIADSQSHSLALYLVDWDSPYRSQTIEVVDPDSGKVLDSRSASNFWNGVYLVWQVSGKVRFRLTRTGGANATVSGIFFDPAGQAAPQPPAATFSASAATVAPGKPVTLTWSTTNASSVSIDTGIGSVATSGTTTVNPTSTTTYTLTAQNAAGAVTKQSTVTVVPLPTATLTVTPSVTAGQPATLSWSTANATSVSIDQGIGAVATSGTKTVTPSASTTYVLTATSVVGSTTSSATVTVTVPPPPPSSSSSPTSQTSPTTGTSAQFLRTDAMTQGIWRGVYGSDGYALAQDGTALPAYAQMSVTGAGNWVWASTTSDIRALQRANGNGQMAAQWYGTGTTFTMDVTFIDAKSHPVALYLVDWDSPYRAQTVEVLDPATNTVLDSRSVSNFRNGVYLVWQVAGKVRFRLTKTAGANATVSGVFFGTGSSASTPPGSARFLRTDTTTLGNWRGRYGVDGYSVAQDATALPAYAQVTRSGASDWVWSASPSDARSLQRATTTGRVAATWYAGSAFMIDVAITDGQSHTVSLYLLDYDSPSRTQTIEVIDLTTGTVLDTRNAASFTNGAYYTWQVNGKIRFKITRTGGANATVSAVFFGAP